MKSMLHNQIINYIKKNGDIPFSVFMEMALFDDKYGYYNSSKVFGEKGDFVTSPVTSSLFGESLANEFINLSENHRGMAIIEIGGGDASMAISMIKQLQHKHCLPEEYIIIESSTRLIEKQKEAIKKNFEYIPDFISWRNNLNNFSPIDGMIIANEFFDVIPTERFEFSNEKFSKLFITTLSNQLKYKWVEDNTLISLFKQSCNNHEINLPNKYRSEINENYNDWIKKIGSSLIKGIVILIDYGYHAREYYLDDRNRGTLVCVNNHSSNFDPLNNIGNQDISAFVNFSHISNLASEYNLKTLGYLSQASLLINLGILDLYNKKTINDNFSELNNLKNILLPNTMGELFKALILSKDIHQDLLSTKEFNQLEKL
tara:strand:+ start:2077 stop:3195 length:1119 start_codon:yes stop_codon:yes gene_type:complete